jgi:H+-transporting ATPase
MITGDQQAIAREMAKTIGLGVNILLSDVVPELPPDMKAPLDTGLKYGEIIEGSDGFAQVFPEHKFMIVEALKQRGWTCGMTGDGVNDAPALKVANVGIAVQGSTAAAQAAADIVLTQPGLGTIITALTLAREIFQRLRNYVIYRISCSAQLLLFFFVSVVLIQVASPEFVGMSPACQNGERIPPSITIASLTANGSSSSSSVLDPHAGDAEVSALCNKQFDLPVTTIVLITLLNNGAIVSIAYDKVVSEAHPSVWRLPEVFTIASERAVPSFLWALLTEIHLCHACSCQEILRRETARQV